MVSRRDAERWRWARGNGTRFEAVKETDMFLEFVEGPLWTVTFVVFSVGMLLRLISIARGGFDRDLAPRRATGLGGALRANVTRFWPHREMLAAERLQLVAGYLFHLGLFVLLLFAAPHVRFIETHILGFGWTPAPDWVFLLAAQAAFLGLLILWLHRLLHPVLQRISGPGDHLATLLTFLAMLTGCLALFEAFDGLLALHMLTVEIWLIYFPFSSLVHALTFPLSRALTGARFGRHGVKA
jgi:nitrate reductase gamma subunit